MNNLNTVLIEGQLTRDPDVVPAPAQSQSCRLAIANNRYYLNKTGDWVQDPSYFSVYVYGAVASACIRYLKKGRGVRVVGRLKQFSWTDNGIRREKICIMAEHIEFQPAKKTEQPVVDTSPAPGEMTTKSDMRDIMPPESEDQVEQTQDVMATQETEEIETTGPSDLDSSEESGEPGEITEDDDSSSF